MRAHAVGTDSPIELATSLVPEDDAQTLQKAIRKSIVTSPDAFLKTIDDVDRKSIYEWEIEVKSATWAVAQRGQEVVGIAAAKWPDPENDADIDKPETTRFIESVWIAPGFRRYRIAERLVKYLLEVECRSDPRIKQFLLWVFDKNFYAIKLYQRMGFEPTGIKKESLERAGLIEIQYRLSFENVVIATDPVVNEAARQHDLREYGVHYRLLGEDFA